MQRPGTACCSGFFFPPTQKNFLTIFANCAIITVMATTHSFSTNITNGNDSDTRNVNSADDLVVSITCKDNITITNRTNVTAQLVDINQTESGSITATLKIRFINNGSYSCTVTSSQSTSGGTNTLRSYSVSGTTSGGTNKEFGLEFFDTSGNLRLGLNTRIPRIWAVKSGNAYNQYYDSGNSQYYNDVTVGGMWAGGSTNWEVTEISDSCNWYIDETYTAANKVRLRKNKNQTTGSGTSALTENNAYILLVLKY